MVVTSPSAPSCGTREVAVLADLVVAELVVAALREVWLAVHARGGERLGVRVVAVLPEVAARRAPMPGSSAVLAVLPWSPSSPRWTSATSPRSTTRGGERLVVCCTR